MSPALAAENVILLAAVGAALIWLASACFVVAYVAEQKARSGAAWFFVALLFTPVFATLCLAALPAGDHFQEADEEDRLPAGPPRRGLL